MRGKEQARLYSRQRAKQISEVIIAENKKPPTRERSLNQFKKLTVAENSLVLNVNTVSGEYLRIVGATSYF